MRRKLSYILSVLALCAGCTDNSFTGPLPQDFYTTSPIAVEASVGSVDGGLTKTGAITSLEMMSGRTVTVFAPRVEKEYPYQIPGNSVVNFQSAMITSDDFFLRWVGEQPYYPNRDRYMERFDFFAWYLDGVESGGRLMGTDHVDIPVTIDGTRDLMYSKAEVTSDLSIMKDNAFSYYTAQRNLIPLFRFSHALTCLDFELRPGVNENRVHKLTIRSIRMRVPVDVRLRVAARDASSLGIHDPGVKPKQMLALREADGSVLADDKYIITTRLRESQKAENLPVGGDFLIPAVDGSSSAVLVDISDDRYTDPYTATVNISHPDGLKAGHRYKVVLTVYGDMEISSSVDLVGWNDAGNIEINPEIRPGND